MSVRSAVSLDEYLHTSFPDLDREFRDGEILERSLPDYSHGKAQLALGAFFRALRKTLSVYPCSETRMLVSNRRVLIPDIAVFYPDEPSSRLPDTPPFIVIEILSYDDRMPNVCEKLEEFRAWGVSHVWLVDPRSRRLFDWDGSLKEVLELTVPQLGIAISPDEAFD